MTSKLQFEIPNINSAVIEALGVAANAAIMNAMRVAIVPTRAYLKSIVNTDTKSSPRSSGATFRAVTSKVARSSKVPNLYYAIIGVSRRTSEEHIIDKNSNSDRLRISHGVRYKLFKSKRRQLTIKSRLVKSRLKRVSLSKADIARGSVSVRRIPSKYWHILEKGFVTRSNRSNMPYRFVMRTVESMQEETKNRFIEQLNKNLALAIKRTFIKAIKNAS